VPGLIRLEGDDMTKGEKKRCFACLQCGGLIKGWGMPCEHCETIERGKRAAQGGLSSFLAAVASIAMAVKLTDEKILDGEKVSAVVQAAKQLNDIVDKIEMRERFVAEYVAAENKR
jgi:hypothetical protein